LTCYDLRTTATTNNPTATMEVTPTMIGDTVGPKGMKRVAMTMPKRTTPMMIISLPSVELFVPSTFFGSLFMP
jgi:hypothetical protein